MASIHRTQLRLDQISGSFFDREGGIIDSLAKDSASAIGGVTINSGSMVGVMSEVASAIKRIHGANTFASQGPGEFSATIKPASDDGAALGSTNNNWSDLFLADSAVINLGDDQDVKLTHQPDLGVLLDTNNALFFRDLDIFISSSANGTLDVSADTEINLKIGTTDELVLNSTTATFGTNIAIPNDGTIGSAGTAASITIQTDGDIELAKDLYLSGTTIDVDGASALAIGASVGSNAITLGGSTSEVVVPGSLIVQGPTTTLTSSNTVIQDAIIGINTSGSEGYGAAAQTRGIIFGGGLLADSQQAIYYDGTSAFVFGATLTSPSSGSIAAPAAAGYTTLKTGDLDPGASNTYALGSTSLMWSDAFLGDGAVINFNNGNVTLTHSTNALTVSDDDKLQFRNANVSLQSSADGVLSIEAAGTIETDSPLTASAGAHFDGDGTANAVLFGAGADFQIEVTGDDVFLNQVTSNKDIIFLGNSGSAGQELARFDVSSGSLAMKRSNAAGTNGGLVSFDGIAGQHEAIYGDGSALYLRSNNVSFKMATTDGASGDFLRTDGSGVLSFAAAGSVVATRQQVISAAASATVASGSVLRSGGGLADFDINLTSTGVTIDELDAGMTVFVNGQMLLSGSPANVGAGTADYHILDGSAAERVTLKLGFDLFVGDVVQAVIR